MKRVVCQDSYLIGRRDLKNGYLTLTFGPFQRCSSIKPGHFVHIDLPGSNLYFRRAFSVYSVNVKEKSIEIFLKVIGRGSRYLAQLKKGDRVNMLGPVGTPFKLPRKNQSALMVAGGVGLPPILFMTRWMIKRRQKPENIVFVYGGRSAEDIIERSIIKRLGVRFLPVTEDGSYGEKELVTAPLARSLSSGHINNHAKPILLQKRQLFFDIGLNTHIGQTDCIEHS